MAEHKYDKYAYGALTLVILVSLGIYLLPDDNYICRSLDLTKECDRLSKTGRTCYPDPDTRKGSKFCSEGWESIATGAVIIPESECEYDGQNPAYCCSVDGCEQIK